MRYIYTAIRTDGHGHPRGRITTGTSRLAVIRVARSERFPYRIRREKVHADIHAMYGPDGLREVRS